MNSFPSSSYQAPTATDGGAAVEDSFYSTLDLGHETQINNDLVRAIRDEIANIDKSLHASADKIKHEERSLAQLTKDCNHAREEMCAHRRDAMEVLDSETMTEELRMEFKAQFASDVAPHLVSPSSSPSSHDNHRDTTMMMSEDDSTTTTSTSRGLSHKAFIERKRVDAKSKAASIQSIQHEIMLTRKKIKAADDETAKLNQEINARQLDKVKSEGERQVEAKRREFEAESQQNRGVKEAVQMARANSGAYAQQIAEKVRKDVLVIALSYFVCGLYSASLHVRLSKPMPQVKEQMVERRNNISKETELTSLNELKQQGLTILEADEKKLDAELAVLSGQLDFLIKQVADFEAAQKKSNEIKIVIDEVRHDIAELTLSKEVKSKDAEASNAVLENALMAFEEMTKLADEANSLKRKNEQAIVDVLGPANARKSNAIKEKEKLASKVVALQKTVETNQNVNQDTASTLLELSNAKFNELEGHKANLDSARVEFEEMCQREATAQANLLNEKQEYEEFSTNFEAATSEEIARLEELKRERFEARQKCLESRRSDLGLLEQAHRDDIENLKYMKDIKTMIEETALLDDNGNEVSLPAYDERVFGMDCDDCDDKDDIMSVHNEAGSPAVKRR